MSEEKPLFLIDVDRAIEGLVSSVPANGGAGSARLESSVMYCVDLANALDGAGLDALSAFASELSESFTANSSQAFLLIPDLVALVNAEASHIHSSGESGALVSVEQLNQAKTAFEQKLSQLKAGAPVSKEPISLLVSVAETIEPVIELEAQPTAQPIAPIPEDEYVDEFPNQEFASDLKEGLRAPEKSPEPQAQTQSPQARVESNAPSDREIELNRTLDRTISELKNLFTPRQESPPVLVPEPKPKAFSIPEGLSQPIDRASAFEYSSNSRLLDKHYVLDRSTNLNRLQKARSLAGKGNGWSGVELDFVLSKEQDELIRVGQQSLRHIFDNLTDELLIDEVYADADVAQQLLTILSILPPCPSIFAVQQELMIFIDLDHISLSQEHLLAVGSMMAEIGGSLEVHHEGVRLSCPSSLLRMPMAYFSRHGEYFAVSAIQYLGEEQLDKLASSKVDSLGEIIHPARKIAIRAGLETYWIYAHEFMGVENMNIHQNIPAALERPHWLAGVALDGANTVYSWVALDRYVR
ncbi:MAG: hypothetical protein B7Y67_17060 [Polynucleobacter sp. 35-46-11]|uniref:hypothetical protein n=1 Tax=Polynucleobacter sp. 35-46-11 TaxID=1970425 RepID=UPI000BD1466F|nr:hypothetical protein [Polynucleobacter sp. 35-46-11]OYY08200.1 MAG: hypothetical protein B7Y67_17060 [Polynucleobacter sp. 35-46-11]